MNEKHIRLQFVCWHAVSWQNPDSLVDFTRTFGFPAFSRNSVNFRVENRKWDSRIWPVLRSYLVRVLSSRRTNIEGFRLSFFNSGLPLPSLMGPSQVSCKVSMKITTTLSWIRILQITQQRTEDSQCCIFVLRMKHKL